MIMVGAWAAAIYTVGFMVTGGEKDPFKQYPEWVMELRQTSKNNKKYRNLMSGLFGERGLADTDKDGEYSLSEIVKAYDQMGRPAIKLSREQLDRQMSLNTTLKIFDRPTAEELEAATESYKGNLPLNGMKY